jgi:hypothetical protein
MAAPNWRNHIGTPSLLLDETFGAAELLAFDLDEGAVVLTCDYVIYVCCCCRPTTRQYQRAAATIGKGPSPPRQTWQVCVADVGCDATFSASNGTLCLSVHD